MPYDPEELKKISKELKPGEDPTLKAASKTGGGFDADNQDPQYHPVISKGDTILVRDDNTTLNWKNYRFTAKFEDGTQQEFVFTAPNDGDAQSKVADRIKSTTNQKGTYKLSLMETPKEIAKGEFGSTEKTVKSNEKKGDKDAQPKASAENSAKSTKAAKEAEEKK